LYESVINTIGFIVLVLVSRKWRWLKEGDVILLYMLWYGVNRIIVESMRPDAWTLAGGLPTAQLISIGMVVVAIGALVVRHLPRGAQPASG
jgi:phosphatidylglycerol:prolipoprotein diacylglycerol transferase